MSNTKKGAGAASNGKGTAKTQSTTTTAKIDTAEALAEKIQFFNEKKELINNRLRLQDTLDKMEDLKIEDVDDFIGSDKDRIRLVFTEGYNRDLLSISAPAFMQDFKEFFMERCKARIVELDKLILS